MIIENVKIFILFFSFSVLVSAADPFLGTSYGRHKRHQNQQQPQKDVQGLSGIGEPYFAEDPVGVRNVTAQLGLTTYLHCKVNNLNGKTVSNAPT